MAQALYRRYRPQRFDALVGQDHVREALRRSVRDGKPGHAYLFSGPRGTGKTTTARILAKALNCLDLGSDGEPCGTCENCVGITEGRFLDLFELDAASNNSVDNIRDLADSVNLGLGATARTKVYIVDEVHMLSTAASNALLKTLEEPPAHVVFVLATTNPEKVLPTIRSRTQHFEFSLLGTAQIATHLGEVLKAEGVDAAPDLVEQVARAGAGSARDALSLLDQALALAADGTLDADRVAGILGRTGFDARAAILGAISDEDAAGVLVELGSLIESGHDARRVAEDVLRAARDAFLLTAGVDRVTVDLAGDEREQLTGIGRSLGNAGLVRTIETLGQAIVDMRGADAADPRLVLEVALVRLARRDAGPPVQALAERVERLERAAGSSSSTSAPARGDASRPASTTGSPPGSTVGALRRARVEPLPAAVPDPDPGRESPNPAETPAESPPTPTTGPLDVDDVILAWADLLPALPVATRSAVQEAQPVRVDDDVVVFAISPRLLEAAKPRFKKVADQIREGLGARVGRTLKFTLVPEEATAPDPPTPPGEPDDEVDLSELVDVKPGDSAVDSVARLQETFGASVVDDHPGD